MTFAGYSSGFLYSRRYRPTVFFRDDFLYPNGDLAAVSGGKWLSNPALGLNVINNSVVLSNIAIGNTVRAAPAVQFRWNPAKPYYYSATVLTGNQTGGASPQVIIRMLNDAQDGGITLTTRAGDIVFADKFAQAGLNTGLPGSKPIRVKIQVSKGVAVAYLNDVRIGNPYTLQTTAATQLIELRCNNNLAGAPSPSFTNVLFIGSK